MQLIVHVKGFYEWVDVPNDVDQTTAEWKRAIKAGKIKPMMNGAWSMQVPKVADTEINIGVSEDDLIQVIIQEMTRGDRQHLSRIEAGTRFLMRHILPQHSHTSNVEEVEVAQDDGPNEELFRKMLKEHIDCHNIDPADFDPLFEAYMNPVTPEDHIDHMHLQLRVKPQKLEAFRAKRQEQDATRRTAREHHLARLAQAAKKDEEV